MFLNKCLSNQSILKFNEIICWRSRRFSLDVETQQCFYFNAVALTVVIFQMNTACE
uniref:Uncharacterized protein n=1 Tax=Anguilla anguilla TaxID=7936 RepID=A0A0E9WTZ4_ANGAN